MQQDRSDASPAPARGSRRHAATRAEKQATSSWIVLTHEPSLTSIPAAQSLCFSGSPIKPQIKRPGLAATMRSHTAADVRCGLARNSVAPVAVSTIHIPSHLPKKGQSAGPASDFITMIAMRFAGGGGTQADLAIGSSFEHQQSRAIMGPANISDFKLDQTFARAARHDIICRASDGRPQSCPARRFPGG